MIQLQSVSKVYLSGQVETTALKDVSLEIRPGEFVAILGPSGCGKSTLLGILGMLDRPSNGSYLFNDISVERRSERQLVQLRRGRIGFVFQSFNLIEDLTIFENVALPLRYMRLGTNEITHRVGTVLESLSLIHRVSHWPGQLSGGQQQRVAIARALVSKPDVILADEPAGNLDMSHGHEVMSLLQEANLEGTTVVMVTHSAQHALFASRTVRLLDGQVVSDTVNPVVSAH